MPPVFTRYQKFVVQRSICGHLTEEMTERYSSVAQAEVQAALGKVVSLAGYRGLLRSPGGGRKRSGGTVVGKPIPTPPTTAASPSQVPVTNSLFLSGIAGSNRRHSAWEADT